MTMMAVVKFDDDRAWAVSSYGIYMDNLVSQEEVVIPINAIDGMTDEEIGQRVRKCIPFAVALKAKEDEYNRQYKARLQTPAPKPLKSKAGYIYLIHGEGTTWYKIGQSTDPHQRNKQLGTQGPFKHTMLQCIKTDDMDAVEDFLHRHFAHCRVEGEWFLLQEKDIKTFNKMTYMNNYSVYDVAEIFCSDGTNI